jgi:quercetin dioxygenase-like cupin family protein
MRKYFNYQVKKTVIVQNLITIEAIETSPTFSYPEEKHEFYEVVYTDSGTINCAFNDKLINLKQGDLLLIPPKTVHSYKAIIDKSASIFIVCFRCTSDFLNIFENKIKLTNDQKSLLAEIIKEA